MRGEAFFSFAGVIALGRPPTLPLARAAASPALVRARISSLSNSARAERMWKMSLPVDLVVPMASMEGLKTDLALL